MRITKERKLIGYVLRGDDTGRERKILRKKDIEKEKKERYKVRGTLKLRTFVLVGIQYLDSI